MPHFIQFIGASQPRRAGTDDRDFFAGAELRRLGMHPAFMIRLLDNRIFDIFNRDRRFMNGQDARIFARRGADAPRKFREIIRFHQPFERLFPAAAKDQIVEFRDNVADRTRPMAERNAAIHAPRPLIFHRLVRREFDKFIPMPDAHRNRLFLVILPGKIQKTKHFSHNLFRTLIF